MHFYKWLERTYPSNGKTITANSVKEEALSIVETALAKFESGMQKTFQPAYAFAA